MNVESPSLDLSALETRVYRQRWDHGLLDLTIGIGLALIGADLLWGEAYSFVVFAVVALPIGKKLERQVLLPRLGQVRFGEARRARLARGRLAARVGLTLALLLGLVLFLLTEPGPGSGRGRLMFGAVLGAAVAGAGVALSLPPLWLWAFTIPAAFLVGHLVGGRAEQPYWVMGAGLGIASIGLVLLLRFLVRNPRPEKEPA